MANEENLMPPIKKGESRNPNGYSAKARKRDSLKREFNKMMLEGQSRGIIWVDEANVQTRDRPIRDKDGHIVGHKKQYGLVLSSMQSKVAKIDKLINGKDDRLAWSILKFLWEDGAGKATNANAPIYNNNVTNVFQNVVVDDAHGNIAEPITSEKDAIDFGDDIDYDEYEDITDFNE